MNKFKILKCSYCKGEKSITDFFKNNTTKRGYKTQCKECIKPQAQIRAKEYYKKRKENGFCDRFDRIDRKKRELKSKYGITLEEYHIMLEKQNGKCAICLGKNKVKYKNEKETFFCIDHNHKTNKIRGILCVQCNAALGMFKDNTDILQRAIEYLFKNRR